MELWQNAKTFLTAPFSEKLDLTALFWTVGAVLVFAVVWVFIMNELQFAAREIV